MEQMKYNLTEQMKTDGIVVILRGIPKKKILNVLEILYEENIKFVEITLNSNDAYEEIEMAVKNYKGKMNIGAGTVNTLDDLLKAKKAGAEFFLTPGINEEVLDYSRKNDLDLIPGFTTVSEAMKAMEYGFNFLKFFPAGSFPKNYLSAIKGPLSKLESMAVGGVNLNNIDEFFDAGHIAVGLGSQMISKGHLENNEWEKIKKNIRTFREKVKKNEI